jgi:glycine/D-amino acid oxidase-like deaminating enzyme
MKSKSDVVIVGGGIAGCTAAYYLAKSGVDVTLLEKGEIASEQSSRAWGFIRQQRRDPIEMPMMMHANQLWRNMQSELGVDFEWTQGGVLAAPGDEPTWDRFSNWVKVSENFGLETQLLSKSQVQQMLPGSQGNYLGGIYTPSDGHAEPGKATMAFARAAEKAGASILTFHAVEDIELAGGKVVGVQTDRGYIATSTVVIAAGAHSAKVARMVGLRLPMVAVRPTVIQTTPGPRLTNAGVWAPDISLRQKPDGSNYVGRMGPSEYDLTADSFRFAKEFLPTHIGNRQILHTRLGTPLWQDIRRVIPGTELHDHPFAEAVGMDPRPNIAVAREGLRRLHRLFPTTSELRVQRTWAGVIDQTPDTVPVIGPTSALEGVVFATGFSGKGFGLGPAVGQIVRDLVTQGTSSIDISPMTFDRFQTGEYGGASRAGDMAARGQA